MVEYGGGINNGPAGQVGGNPGAGGGDPQLGTPVDFFGSVSNGIGDAANWLFALPPETLFLGIVAVFVGLIVLRRAF
jgi:hypothetical protein